MISYAEGPIPRNPLDDLCAELKTIPSPEEQTAKIGEMAAAICAKHQRHIDEVFAQAILDANGGVPPTDEELKKWCRTLMTMDGTVMLAWKAPDWKPGEKVDLSYVIAKVPPPKIG